MTLRFAEPQTFDESQHLVRFQAVDGDRVIPCAVSEEALYDVSASDDMREGVALNLYQIYRSAIQRAAQVRYEQGLYGSDGVVLVDWLDLYP